MFQLDEYESRFNRAAKPRYRYAPPLIDKVLLVTDLTEAAEVAELERRVRRLLRAIEERGGAAPCWEVVQGDAYATPRELLALIAARAPDLVVTQRGLETTERAHVHSLGMFVDAVAQASPVPTLILPTPREGDDPLRSEHGTPRVCVMTDHLTGDDRLVNWGVRFVQGERGDLFLTHVEDDVAFRRLIDVIGKIDELDTAVAERTIKAQLLREPADFIGSCREALEKKGIPLRIHEVVKLGHRVREYRSLVEEHGVDLLVLNAKDDEQVALHGVAYALTIELTNLPLLLL